LGFVEEGGKLWREGGKEGGREGGRNGWSKFSFSMWIFIVCLSTLNPTLLPSLPPSLALPAALLRGCSVPREWVREEGWASARVCKGRGLGREGGREGKREGGREGRCVWIAWL
jgi:hypothetical protein